MSEPVSIQPPNYTQIPNAILDLMADMSDAELRVVLAIARQTFGWHKKRDKISLSQLMVLTGMSRQGVLNGIDAGIKRRLIERRPDPNDKRGGIWYRLIVHGVDQSTSLTSHEADQSTTLTGSSQRRRPDLVNDVDTQKKGKERKERESEKHAQNSPARTPAVSLYFEFYPNETLDADNVTDINDTVTDLARWREVLKYWRGNSYRAKSVPKMLDRYRSGVTLADERPVKQNGHRPQERPPPDLPLTVAKPKRQSLSAEERQRILNEVRPNDTS